jgi:hypothetical protein
VKIEEIRGEMKRIRSESLDGSSGGILFSPIKESEG